MKRILSYVPALFCLESVLFLLRSSQLLLWFGSFAAPNRAAVLPVLGVSGLIVAWGLTQKKVWAYRGGFVLSALQTVAMPLSAPAGLLLVACLLKAKDLYLVRDPMARVKWDEKSGGKSL